MSRLFSPLFCRFLATVLLVLDLSQEPLSALPSPTPVDSDDMVTEIATHEEFWWGGPTRPGPEVYMGLAAEHASPSPNQLPPNIPSPVASTAVTKSVAISQAPSHPSALVIPAHFACPEPPPISIVRTLAFSAPQHRNTSLGHRASVLLLI